ncbi:penicillin-binding transpeptidase domain-containing protein [Candidatus Poriferisodalis sp.]|uniref:penicillin-binding transpeptidase domain-containing protein n=1 Tax=Candidatus Poriferisodalis sp. TaxID=3101277 RepID=UPI003B522AEB
MNRRITRLAVALAVSFAVLLVQLTNIGFLGADELRRHELNTRAAAAAIGSARGAIISADGETIAPGIGPDDSGAVQVRTYPHGSLYAHIAGYLSPAAGASGLERSWDAELSGTAIDVAVTQLADLFADSGRVGDVILTVNHGVQLTARAALGDRDGAVVVVDPATGAIVAMWSRPSFDPNAQVLLAPDAVATSASPPVARAYQRHYPLSADAALDATGDELLDGARRQLGSTGIDLPGEPDGAVFGVGVPLTPLQLALAAAAIANDGVRMRPYVVQRVDARSASRSGEGEPPSPDGSAQTTPRDAGRIFEIADAAGLLARMAAQAQLASISLAPTDGVEFPAAVATGQLLDPNSDRERTGSWAVLLAPAEAPTVAVAVLLEPDTGLDVGDPQAGGTLAMMIAATAAEAALALRAVPTSFEVGP